ncbi:MAG: YdcF family protein [Cellulosilyticum sp.]|nr:YdcF family protein [Cellulosilyticum sp.]MEE1072134.1 YdcF family protein [Cellulosilyticum sp.]
MIYFWRILLVFSMLNLLDLIIVGIKGPMPLVWFAIIVISFILSFKKPLRYVFSHKSIKGLFFLGMTFFIIIESIIIFYSINLNIPSNADYLIVLGAGVHGETPSLTLQDRLNTAYDYLKENPHTKAILTGGQGPGETITEAEAMFRYLTNKGIPADRLLLEEQATDTVENLTYSFKLIDSSLQNPEVIVVTNKFHILRSQMIAQELEWKVHGLGSRTLYFLIPTYYLREFFAVIAEFIF